MLTLRRQHDGRLSAKVCTSHLMGCTSTDFTISSPRLLTNWGARVAAGTCCWQKASPVAPACPIIPWFSLTRRQASCISTA